MNEWFTWRSFCWRETLTSPYEGSRYTAIFKPRRPSHRSKNLDGYPSVFLGLRVVR